MPRRAPPEARPRDGQRPLLVELHHRGAAAQGAAVAGRAFAPASSRACVSASFAGDSDVTPFGDAAPARGAHYRTWRRARPDKPFKQKLMPLGRPRCAGQGQERQRSSKKLAGAGARRCAEPRSARPRTDMCVESDGKADSVYLRASTAGQLDRGAADGARGGARGAADPQGDELPARRRHDHRAVRAARAPAGRAARRTR